ncbi:MAG TPA: hypothetical protein VEH55_06900 [Gaiellaceae bacterium]|nr:hypothetical protein [Gaiellaceae bacterium]
MSGWIVESVVHFEPGDFVKDGLAHFGFHARDGRYYAISHQQHHLGLVGPDDRTEWTVAPRPVFEGVPNIAADLEFPMYVDALPDGTLVVSSFGNGLLHRVDPESMSASILVDGRELGLVDMGNCVVDDEGFVWVNEVRGCRVWRFDRDGRPVETLGDGSAGFQADSASFDEVRFGWIYDIRRGPDGTIHVLDSSNFALRTIDTRSRTVQTLAGNGKPGYAGDGGHARLASFGSDPAAAFDGPISLALDDAGNAFVGDRFNHVVRMIDRRSGIISTIAGRPDATAAVGNDPAERDPLRLDLPQISSMDFGRGRLLVPTDLAGDSGDLAVLRRL